MNRKLTTLAILTVALPTLAILAQQGGSQPNTDSGPGVGYTDTPQIPNQKWRVHDSERPRPRVIDPGTPGPAGRPPSDAIVLFDGKDLSKWHERAGRGEDAKFIDARWKVENGYFEVAPRTGDLISKDSFGDAQYHVEWASPAMVRSSSQDRGNSGFIIMSRYEVQVLDSWNNPTYADGQAASMYGQWPPLVNAVRPPGEWQTYDIIFEAPRFEAGKLTKPAYVTVIHNGVVVQNHQAFHGPMAHRTVTLYQPHEAEAPLTLQQHGAPVRYRNIWVRRLTGYDQK